MLYSLSKWSICIKYCRFLKFSCYGTSIRCSAGSQIFFLDKQSETCWKLSADENRSYPSQNIQNQKSSNLCRIIDVYGRFISNIVIFRIYVLLCKHKVLCGISDIFPRQTIRDLLKFFCRWESKLSFSKYTKSKSTQFVL